MIITGGVFGTIAAQNASNVSITGGTITGITDISVSDGGTGASNPTQARTNLGIGTIGTQNADAVAITGGTVDGLDHVAFHESDNHAFKLRSRDDVSIAYPVPYLYPNGSGADYTIGFDLFPKGAPGDVGGGLGKAWIHGGDTDIVQFPSAPSRWFQIGITTSAATFGSRTFNGGTSTPIWFYVDGTVEYKLSASLMEVIHATVKIDVAGSVGTPALEINGAGIYQSSNTISLTPNKSLHCDVTTTGITYSIAGGGNNFLTLVSEGAPAIVLQRSSANASEVDIIAQKSRGTIASPAILVTNDVILDIIGQGHNGSAFDDVARIRMQLVETSPAVGAMGGRMLFHLNAIGGTTLNEILRLDNENGLSMFGANKVIDQNRNHVLRSYAKASLPSAATAGIMIFVTDDVGGSTPAFSDGTNWRRVADRAVIS
jgi:hypothetical protein